MCPQVVNFVCPVRGFLTQTLNVTNPTNQQCTISPVIEGEQWSAAPSMIFEPLQNKAYRITYRPVTMTADGQKHQVVAFFVHVCAGTLQDSPKTCRQ